ncbi:MAG TPA: sigma-70 family RNA polymerase sigma factor [Bryobacteraceae bacterium]|nr:sigma-70 family RNA polymerase sigma factor [Bryobacteraceae bacterium]HUI58300.1 sigma-70 family RNA polymerase sigma factor [Bryobacteraceae bacterium]
MSGTALAMMSVVGTDAEEADDILIRAAAKGDRGAFGELYIRYARMVHGILLARVPAGDAEDLVQDVFVSAMRQLRDLRTAAAFRGWLAAIARNRAIDYFRSARANAALDEGTERKHGIRPAVQEAVVVLDLIRSLPEAYRETLILRLVEGMTGPEIARQTGLSPDSVRVNLCRGMKLLREAWGGMEKQ